jgi:hypothetical protein
MSKNLQIRSKFFDIDETWESINLHDGSTLSSYNDKTYYITPMDFNIYQIQNDSASIAYTFELGTVGYSFESKKYTTYMENLNNYVARFYNFQETSEHLIVRVLYKGQYLLGIYNKKSTNTYVAKLEPYTDKYFFPFGQIVSFDEKAIYAVIEATDMKRMWNGKDEYNDFESKYPDQIKRLREKFNNITEDGNPFLIIYHIR